MHKYADSAQLTNYPNKNNDSIQVQFSSNQDYLRAGPTVRWPITEQRLATKIHAPKTKYIK